MSAPIRARLTVWYALLLTLVMTVADAGFYLLYSRTRLGELDLELTRAAALVARLVPAELDEGSGLAEAAGSALEDIEMPGRSLAVLDRDGVLLSAQWEDLPRDAASALGAEGPAAATIETAAGAFRLHRTRHRHRDTIFRVGVAQALAPLERELGSLRRALAGSLLLALLLAAFGGWWAARAALRPVGVMAAQARVITDRTPGVRLVSPNPRDELGLLATAFNDLLHRLEATLSQQRQFMADASHELRTPVSVARTAIEVALSRLERPADEYRDSLEVAGGQMRHLSRIVADLFTLARADAAGLPVDRRLLYLDELVADCVGEARVLAEPRGVALEQQGQRDLEVRGDEGLLRQMLTNLLDNAVQHTPAGGKVRVEVAALPDALEVRVVDGGPGIPEADRERVFDRFVRLDPRRGSRDGAGLGLPIARAIAEAHDGTLVLERSDAAGSTFRVRLGRAEPAP